MMDSFHFDPENHRLAISGELTIYQAGEARAALLNALEQGPLLEIDLGGVTELDTAGLQLLLLAKRVGADDDEPLLLVNHSRAVLDVLALTRLGAELDAREVPA